MQFDLPDFNQQSALVVGDLMLDRYWQGPVSRISPEAPVPIVRVEDVEERPGGAANVALNLARLGVRVGLAGLIGVDEAGERLRQLIKDHEISDHMQMIETAPTITKLRILSQHQQLVRLDFEKSIGADVSVLLEDDLESKLNNIRVLVLSDYAKGTLSRPQSWINAARARGIPVLVDPKGNDFERYKGATLLTPNLKEFEGVVGQCETEQAMFEKGEQLRSRLTLEALIITLGNKGMLLIEKDRPPFHLPTQAREVFDVTGAGDTVIAVLAATLAAGWQLKQAVGLANLAAGLMVAKLGASSITPAELMGAMEQDERLFGVMDERALLREIKRSRIRQERIVMTNGCFDLLHEGHVNYLRQARELGDRLIVAVNDDESVRRLKGDDRPYNGLGQRMAVLAGLSSVDWVVPFNEDTPEKLICSVKPDLLVKGGDYTPDQIAGSDCVIRAGGEVKVLGFVENRSTSAILNKIRGNGS